MRQRVIKSKNTDAITNTQVLREVTRPKIKAKTLADKIANDDFHYKNYMYTGGQTKFPHQKEMWYVDRFYPYAECGPLAVDEANFQQDIDTLMLKKNLLKEVGVKYICIAPGMTENEVVEQLA